MWKNYVARGRALLGWRRMACALAAKVAGSRAHGLQRLRKRTDGSDARAFKRSILRGREGVKASLITGKHARNTKKRVRLSCSLLLLSGAPENNPF